MTQVEVRPTNRTGEPEGTIAVATGSNPRCNSFWDCLSAVLMRHPNVQYSRNEGLFTAVNRNNAVAKMKGDWIWFLDDDMQFPGDILDKLLARNKPVIGPLYLMRYPPFNAITADPVEGEDKWYRHALIPELPKELMRCGFLGGAGLLVRREVFAQLEEPYFAQPLTPDMKDYVTDDYYFCKNCIDHGVEVWADMVNVMGHQTVCTLAPARDPATGQWFTKLVIGGKMYLLPQEPGKSVHKQDLTPGKPIPTKD